jgi:hypothetical protein
MTCSRCHAGAETCFGLSFGNEETQTMIHGFATGTNLIKTAPMLAALLGDAPKRRTEFAQPIGVERAPARGLVGPAPRLVSAARRKEVPDNYWWLRRVRATRRG